MAKPKQSYNENFQSKLQKH